MGLLNNECRDLHDDLQRQQDLVVKKERVIIELRDEACTLWASGWLSFQRKASKVFLVLCFDFPVPTEDEIGESEFDEEDDLGVSSTVPSFAFLLGDPEVEAARPLPSDA